MITASMMEAILGHEAFHPDVPLNCGKEPSLRTLILKYYGYHFPPEQARALTDQYIQRLTEYAVIELVSVETPELPDGLYEIGGVIYYDCLNCEQKTEWPVEVEDFDINDPNNVCGRSPRCCP